ncbi:hypothetical protein M5D96_007196 [Drosophila gunungcola]|uniref:Uncharacterized protein n=1 Tax=Drosophila gunungcola TaxID=103775 RepID=A0A9Q0BPG6_9MUSC|nr:hypothetical protein M5D96_007196 [Drosophila gunungcola]
MAVALRTSQCESISPAGGHNF